MKGNRKNAETTLDRFLARSIHPSSQEIDSSRQRVFEHLQADKGLRLAEPEEACRPRQRSFAVLGISAAVASAIAIAVLLSPKEKVDARITVQAVDGTLHRLINGDLRPTAPGNKVEASTVLRSAQRTRATFTLADGTHVEVRPLSELFVEPASDGVRIRLNKGGIIVEAAKQRAGHLYVQTKDVTVSVIGTVFTVNAEEEGSRVSVIEGEVQVRQGNIETKLRPGEHVSTAATTELLALKEEIAWSPRAGEHLALLQQAQSPSVPETPRQRFELESIRPCAPEPKPPAGARGGGGGGGRIQATPGRFYAPCVTLAKLIKASYPVSDPTDGIVGGAAGLGVVREIPGGPDWMSTDLYAIEAVTDGPTDASTITNVMLPELLERRFQLKVHIETEQIPALALTIADTGLKIKPFQEGDCLKGGPIVFPSPTKPRCSMVNGGFNGANWRWEQGSNPLDAFLINLSSAFRLPVINRTGNSDKFALIFEFGPDATTPGALRACQQVVEKSSPDQAVPCLGQPTAPPIHTALDQLGLRVEPVKAPREFIVVDRAERPSPN